ncbi:MAG: ribosome biogenesis GTPase Der [Alphaproteobacteria bacterium]|nr:ribosome biogenesis GTPase Der [Alphaproteobacteria bacterium]MCW5739104.1 ribosome biogenesis GTPase Der [Alphaproteobacteria bacterium]
MTRPRIALVGRPNVGKSTLFNRLAGRRMAIVADEPGTTRDRREANATIGRREVVLTDTAGWEEAVGDRLEAGMRKQSERAVSEADAVLLVIDARAGLTPLDRAFAQWLRRHARKTIVIANKAESAAADPGIAEAHALGLGDPVPVSAEHGIGIGDIAHALDRVLGKLPEPQPEEDAPFEDEAPDDAAEDVEDSGPDPSRPIQLAIVGRPNVGKSTLLNRLLGDERVLTGPEAGTTRDAIAVEWMHEGRPIRLIDTAGLRRRANVSQRLEALSAKSTEEAIRFAEVVILVLDAQQMMEKQDLTIARHVIEEGRGLVLAVNKTDLLGATDKARNEQWKKLTDRLQASLAQVKGLPIVGFSARTGRGVDKLMPAVAKLHKAWNSRVPTPLFNRWLGEMVERNPPPLVDGRRIKLRYGSQVKSRPPTFALFVSKPADLPESYERYLVNRLREDFDLPGTPIRIVMRKPKNPYAKS